MAPPKAVTEFVAEATEILEALSRDLGSLDQARGQEPEPELLNGIFRAAHSLKGLAAMFGQDAVSRLAHQMEDVLDALRLGKVAPTDALLDALIEALDVLQALLSEASSGKAAGGGERATALAARLKALTTAEEAQGRDALDEAGIEASLRAVLTEYEEHRLRENVRKGVALWTVRAVFSLDDFDQGLARLTTALKPHGEVVSTLPSSQPGDERSIAFDLVFGSRQPRATLEGALGNLATLTRLGKGAPPSAPVPAPPRPRLVTPEEAPPPPDGVRRAEPSLRSLSQTVRVDISRLDGLMNAVGELLLARGKIARLAEAAIQDGSPALRLFGQSLQQEVRTLERRLDELQKGVLDARMVPLGQVFDKLARLMRRLVRESGKQVDFEVHGGDVELDKLIVEELSDPLMHLLRNALDHGVEAPEAREAAGKGARATIRLKARQQGNHVVLEVGDDGAGMDEHRIAQVARERGLIDEARALGLERRELLNLVFLPGFSTRRDVSELSGRGVGLDVVKHNLARLSGLIDIESARGQGTRFVLTLPLTLAIIRALMVEVAGRVYAVPLNAVTEIEVTPVASLRTVERQEVMELRGQTLPLLRLARVFGLPERPSERLFVVVVGLAQQRIGLAVDELQGQQDIVTKPLGGRLRRVRGISGAAELGDRRSVLVLDVAALFEESGALASGGDAA